MKRFSASSTTESNLLGSPIETSGSSCTTIPSAVDDANDLDFVHGAVVGVRMRLVENEVQSASVTVHSAGLQDRDGADLVLDKIRQRFPWLELVWADSGYNAH
jgi:hypothetical protein